MPPIGIVKYFTESMVKSNTINLKEKTFVVYTDGVTEAPGMSGERFDENRLITFLDRFARQGLGAQQILDKLFERLDGFVGVADHHLEDDASMVVLKVNEELTLPELT